MISEALADVYGEGDFTGTIVQSQLQVEYVDE